MTAEEILEILSKKFDKEKVIYEEYEVELMTELLGKHKIVKQHGGEGEGNSFFIVIHFEQHDIYIELYGSYDSQYGVNANSYVEVFPRQVTTTEYFTKKEEPKDLSF